MKRGTVASDTVVPKVNREEMNAVVILAFLLPSALGANILAVFSITSFSHQIVYRNLMLELNKRGHSVTVITPNPVRNGSLRNYREIDASSYYKIWNEKMVANPMELRITLQVPEMFIAIFVHRMSVDMCRFYMSLPEVQKLVRDNPKFDLLITEFGINPCFYGFAKFSGWKHIGMFSFQTNPVVHANMGNPTTPSYISDVNFPYLDKMNFFQRLRTMIYQSAMWFIYVYTMWTNDSVAREYLGAELPDIKEIERNVSAVLVNTHFSLSFPRPNVPNMVEIGGPPFHLIGRTPKPLPQDIKEFMDSAKHGVIYFSLGTNVKTNNISVEEEKTLLETFGRLKQKVLWKWENDNLSVNLKNVMKAKWFPQVDVLAHPKTVGFVTQAGLQSIGEAIEYHVPMVAMPFFADQNHNARKMESVGAAIYMDFVSMTPDSLTDALNQIVYNETYKESIKKLSALVRDQPMPPLERAVWWTEYVIRHDGAPHLRHVASQMSWIEYLNFDVVAVLISFMFFFGYLIFITARALLKVVLTLFRTNPTRN